MNILVTLDGSKFAEAVLPKVASLTKAGDRVTLVRVIDEARVHATFARPPASREDLQGGVDLLIGGKIPREAPPVVAPVEDVVQAEEGARHEAQDYLEGIARKFFAGNASAVVLAGTDPAKEIVAYARKQCPDLIAMATHGRTGLAQMVVGSVAQRLLRAGIAPVLLVRPDGLTPEVAG